MEKPSINLYQSRNCPWCMVQFLQPLTIIKQNLTEIDKIIIWFTMFSTRKLAIQYIFKLHDIIQCFRKWAMDKMQQRNQWWYVEVRLASREFYRVKMKMWSLGDPERDREAWNDLREYWRFIVCTCSWYRGESDYITRVRTEVWSVDIEIGVHKLSPSFEFEWCNNRQSF